MSIDRIADLRQFFWRVVGLSVVVVLLCLVALLRGAAGVQIVLMLLLLALNGVFVYRIWATLRDARKRFTE